MLGLNSDGDEGTTTGVIGADDGKFILKNPSGPGTIISRGVVHNVVDPVTFETDRYEDDDDSELVDEGFDKTGGIKSRSDDADDMLETLEGAVVVGGDVSSVGTTNEP